MSQKTVTLNIKPFTLSTLPTDQALIDAARAVFDNLDSWKSVKAFKNKKGHHPYLVQTFVKPKAPTDEVSWFMRYSVHKPQQDGTFDDFWNLLGKNKAINEKEFIPEIKSVALLTSVSPTQSVWTLHYTFPPPVTPRTFTVLQAVHVTGGEHGLPREGWIISVPVDVSEDAEMKSKEAKGIRGRYASVEVLKEKEDGSVEWRMATASTPGGLIPKWLAQMSIPGQIEKDVGHFLDWMQTKKNNTNPSMADAAPASTEPSASTVVPDSGNADGPTIMITDESAGITMADETAMNNAPPEQVTAPTDAAIPSDAPATAAETTHM